ncbi:MAG: hypothetical protein UT65_C0002G0019 [Parcubacteria group bacterium GW2011_GWF2_39_8b]|uniref:Uncharacterized protein n=3 Tax=Candidatus Zambryskiibacteriota TaxID=1817925 RepID=A0A1G2T911_9BACT|nr:MAG: hypothetical protein UT65_C0002G0019 [Parcubacteria group bacterium GW2011_GWF2_39_8b]KKR46032.1 MAG: hypothetical protein UT81_C0003G0049 [Parcubacteria group bacterium GW2011_GWA2_40_14]OHA93753.1 MAG: hypothetical protein A2W58_01445 [Candidatus Zambryskibacteria bacterium RIFCSPHIGHO2_02_38_10.5]OHA95502.1 MAG: hypothetical protein A3C63_00450 [Candidatus Zambryskibacteria bacterium RIFCSPHIGHO2_02_FULL_39_82]OHA98922.1 MAG: hypothetical protein A3E32_01305 [Candidatus Zambryskibact
MFRNTERGYIGFVILAIVAVALGAVSLFFYEQKKPTPSPTEQLEKIVMEDARANQLANVVEATTTIVIATTTEIKTEQLVPVPVSKKIVSYADTPPKPTAKPTIQAEPSVVIPPSPPKEPTLIVETGEQPKQTLLIGSARLVPFTVVNLTAKETDIEIESLEVERKGMGSDRIFVEVGVIDHGLEKKLNANHQYVMRKPFTIKAGETEEITLYGNITDKSTLATYEGQSPSLALIKININAKTPAKISGVLPIVGTAHIVNSSLTIGSMTLSSSGFDPGINKNIYINDTGIIFSAVRGLVGGSEVINLQFFGWTQNGSASYLNISNVQICVFYKADTKCFPADVDSVGKYYSAEFGDMKIGKGESFDLYIKGDVLPSGVNRTVNFDITTSYDVLGLGQSYNNFIYSQGGELDGAQPEGSFSITEYPFYNGYAHSIVSGSFNNIGR